MAGAPRPCCFVGWRDDHGRPPWGGAPAGAPGAARSPRGKSLTLVAPSAISPASCTLEPSKAASEELKGTQGLQEIAACQETWTIRRLVAAAGPPVTRSQERAGIWLRMLQGAKDQTRVSLPVTRLKI